MNDPALKGEVSGKQKMLKKPELIKYLNNCIYDIDNFKLNLGGINSSLCLKAESFLPLA